MYDWTVKSYQQVLKELRSSLDGLQPTDVSSRKKKYGLNKLPEPKKNSYFQIFLDQFKSPLIYILLIAALIVFLLGEYIDGFVILFVLLFNAVLGTFQEGKAQNALFALQHFASSSEVSVIRDGDEKIITDVELVPGDIVVLQDGDKIPADGRLIEVSDLKTNESALTGESKSVSKQIDRLHKGVKNPADQVNMVFKGSYVTAGSAKFVVTGTGLQTVVGKISQKLKTIDKRVPLQDNIKYLSKVIVAAVLAIGALVFTIGVMHGNTAMEMFKTVVAISVSTIPEGLPVVITLVLATGVWRMSKRNALVKKLKAVEALGEAKIIAVDKTGTITKNELQVQYVFVDDKDFAVTGDGYEPEGSVQLNGKEIDANKYPDLLKIAEIGAYGANSHASYIEDKDLYQVHGDPTEAAFLVFSQKLGLDKKELESKHPKVKHLPFSSDLKFQANLVESDDGLMLSAIGAPEKILNMSNFILENGQEVRLTGDKIELIKNKLDEYSKKGLRVVACSYKHTQKDTLEEEDVKDTVFLGLFVMSDVIREEAKESVQNATEAGVKVVMITGDHKITAKAIAKQVGVFKEGDDVIENWEIDNLSDEELLKRLPKTSVFARITPEHKLRIIELYKKNGQTVAMTGDGVNDALPLVAADLGVAMGKVGTDVAKEASDIILLDDNFGSILAAMEEGRNIYQKIKKIILYLFSTSFAEVLVISLAVLAGLPLPLIASQIIWLNLVTDGLLVAPLSLDPNDKNILKKKFKKPTKWIIDRLTVGRMVLMSSVMAAGTLMLFVNYVGASQTHAWTISLTTLAAFQWFNVWNVRSEIDSIFSKDIFSNKWLIWATVLAVGLQLLVVYAPFMQTIFRTESLSLNEWGMILATASSIIFVEEARKLIQRRNRRVSKKSN